MNRASSPSPTDPERRAPRDGSASPLWRPQPQFSHVVTGAGHLEQLNEGGGIAVAFARLPKTALHIAFGGSQSEQLSVWTTRSESGFRTSRKIDADLVTIRFVHSGAMSRNGTRGDDIAVAFDQALFGNFVDMQYEQASPGFSAITATVGRDAIVDACRTLGGSGCPVLPQFAPVVDSNSLGLAALRHTIGLLLHHLPDKGSAADLMTPLLEELLVYQFVSAWPASGAPAGGAGGGTAVADRPVRIAIDYIEANLRRRVAIADIAAAAGLSVRMLQIAFKRRLGYSPVQYLIARRLDRVHADLLAQPGRTVRQIATDWGFVHMSDFGRRYRERFGHTPGDSLVMRARSDRGA